MDTKFEYLIEIYGMKVVSPQEYGAISPENKNKALKTQISLSPDGEKNNLLSISFEDTITGKNRGYFSGTAQGDMSNSGDRSKILQIVSNKIIKALKKDKGLLSSKNKLLADELKVILPGKRSQEHSENTVLAEFRVTATTLNVRKAPMVGFDIVGQVKKGDVLKKISLLMDWVEVKLPSGEKGWVSMKYLQPVNE